MDLRIGSAESKSSAPHLETLGKLFNISDPQFLHVLDVGLIASILQIIVRTTIPI